ncbi:ImmA/IrrE family metallo-endopeptidase [Photobacterium sp. DNB23_23_1]
MPYQRVIFLSVIFNTLCGCVGLQTANETASQFDHITNSYVVYDIKTHNAFSDMDQIKKEINNSGITLYTPDYLNGFTFLIISQITFLRSEVNQKSVANISTTIEGIADEEFADLVMSFTEKELRTNSTRGTRFYDLTNFNANHERFAVIVYDEYTLTRFKWPNEQVLQDAVSFSLLHEVGHALAGVKGSPVYDYISQDTTVDEDTLRYYMETYADIFAAQFAYSDLSHAKASQLLLHMIGFRAKTLTSFTHDTSDVLIGFRKKRDSQGYPND